MRIPGFLLGLLLLVTAGAVAQENSDCLMCHADKSMAKGTKKGKTITVFVDIKKFKGSPHADLPCIGCHADLAGSDFPHAEEVKPVVCGSCHKSEQALHANSLHGKALARGDKLAPTCKSCHGTHEILPTKDPRSPVSALRVPFLCGTCHREGSPVMRQRNIHADHILENFSESIHGEGLLKKGLVVAPNCASCHTAHSILPHTDPNSSINRLNIAKTCTRCHAEIEMVHRKIIRGELWEKEPHKLPACVDCHQPHKIRRIFYAQGMADADCMKCHAQKDLRASDDGRTMFVNPNEFTNSKHVKIACSQCHSEVNASKTRSCETITHKVQCASCHADVGTQYSRSTHGQLAAANDPNAPLCKECHGTHGIRGKSDPASPIFPTHIPDLCGQCHKEGQKAARRYTGKQHNIIENYTESIHGRGLSQSGLTVTATCTNCHTAHNVLPAANSESSVNPKNIPATCGNCHHGIQETFAGSVHATLVGKTDKPLPVCSDCHSSHTIQRADAEGFKLEIMAKCGRCHEEIAKTYFDTYHGKVSQLGYTKTAKCYDCHGSHDILAVSNPNSHLSHANVVATCQKCHAGANRQFAGYLTHATHHDPAKYPLLFWVFWSMTSLVIVTFLVGGMHTILWLPRAFQMRKDLKLKQLQRLEEKKKIDERASEEKPEGGA